MDEIRRNEVVNEISLIRQKIRMLEAELRGFNKVSFQHVCPKCGAQWIGNKENIKECTFCHRRIVYAKPSEILTGKVKIGSLEENCAKFDALVRTKGEVVKRHRKDRTKEEMLLTWIFRVKEDGFEYIKKEAGVELVHRMVKGSVEILKDFGDWALWLKGLTWEE